MQNGLKGNLWELTIVKFILELSHCYPVNLGVIFFDSQLDSTSTSALLIIMIHLSSKNVLWSFLPKVHNMKYENNSLESSMGASFP